MKCLPSRSGFKRKEHKAWILCHHESQVEEEAYEEVEEEAPKDEAEIQVVFYFTNNRELSFALVFVPVYVCFIITADFR
ncbi:hypothetical protein IMY05_010G0147400 [Salix suchowensis]|nr:hypothetical protein IMY05_010G0147400 [Salix suchowensis]